MTDIVMKLIFLFFALLQFQSSTAENAARNDFTMFYISGNNMLPKPSAPCLVEGRSLERRDDYTYLPNLNGYKLNTRAVKWNEARLLCQQEGGHLAIINSVAESNAISQFFRNSSPIVGSSYVDDAFIGFHDLYRPGDYVTIHDQSLQQAGFDLWDVEQPNNVGTQRCGGIHKSGLLNDLWCDQLFGFICEIPISQSNRVGNSVSGRKNLE